MATFKVRTRGGVDPHGKAKVYFTCHPEDFDKYFDKICHDVFVTHDCAVYYTPDMTEHLSEEDFTVDLGSIGVFVVPVTAKLLCEPSRAMHKDIAYARAHKIFIIPFMMESGIDALYTLPDNFADVQYISPFSHDATEIDYADKLKTVLDAVLVSDGTAQRVRDAFDAYVFLSYRKKDRKYVSELMRAIHAIPGCRDIAVWYDEFLTPGESFNENIDKAIKKSSLFTLLVTPNLLERDNFIMREEYPAAKRSGLKVLPTEMALTDQALLAELFADIPECAHLCDERFTAAMRDILPSLVIAENDSDPEHNYLIGLAYLDGIDVEVDRERGVELITSAAEKSYPEAMAKLAQMYQSGYKVDIDYPAALYWLARLADMCTFTLGAEHPNTLAVVNNLAAVYLRLGAYKQAAEQLEGLLPIYAGLFGDEDARTLTVMSNLAFAYGEQGNETYAFALYTKIYEIRCRTLGDEHPSTLHALNNIAYSYQVRGDRRTAREIYARVYEARLLLLGEEHPDTVFTLSSLGELCLELDKYDEGERLLERAYGIQLKVLGEKNPETLRTAHNLGAACNALGEYQKSVDLLERAFRLREDILGLNHPDTMTTLDVLGAACFKLGDYARSFSCFERLYELRRRFLGEEHEDTLYALVNLAAAHAFMGEYTLALEMSKKAYGSCLGAFGEGHWLTRAALRTCERIYRMLMGGN